MLTMPSSPHTGKTDSIGWKLTSTDLGTVILASIFVLARLYTKAFIVRHVGWEDFLCVAALLVAIGRTALDIVAVKAWMLGHHIVDVPPSALQGEIVAIAVDGYLYVLAITLAKLSLLLFLYRIFSVSTRFRVTSWILGTIISVWALVTILLGLFSCKPIVAQSDYKLRFAPTTVCKPASYDVENVYGFCNILADFMLLLMPMPMLWRLQMATAKKVGERNLVSSEPELGSSSYPETAETDNMTVFVPLRSSGSTCFIDLPLIMMGPGRLFRSRSGCE